MGNKESVDKGWYVMKLSDQNENIPKYECRIRSKNVNSRKGHLITFQIA